MGAQRESAGTDAAEGWPADGGGQLLINLRAEADPDVLAAETFAVLARQLEMLSGLVMSSMKSAHFRPGKPVHRVAVA